MTLLQRAVVGGDKKKALGRGMGALIAEARSSPVAPRDAVLQVDVDSIRPDAHQPRRTFADESLDELARSLKQQGVLIPLLVRREGKHYRLIAGERRWRAAQRAGLAQVPVLVKDVSEKEAFEWALIENIQRQDLNPLEEAEAYHRLLEQHGWTQEQLAERVGKERPTVANSLRLLALPVDVKALVASGELGMGHARALLGLGRPQDMGALAREAVAGSWSVRQVEAAVKGSRGGGASGKKGSSRLTPEARRLVEDLQRKFGTRVRLVDRGNGKGRLEVEFFSYEDLDRIVNLVRRA